MPTRIRPVSAAQVRAYAAKAQEFAEAAASNLEACRNIAATSLAIHAGINSADAVCGARLASRCGRVRGRGYVDETEAAWELVEEAIEPFRSDTERRAKLGHADAAASLAIGIVAGLYRVREPEMGSVLAHAGEDATNELDDGD